MKQEIYEKFDNIERLRKAKEYNINSLYGEYREQQRRYNMVYNKYSYLTWKKQQGKTLTKTQEIFLVQLRKQLDRKTRPTMYTSAQEYNKIKITASNIFKDLQKKGIYNKYNTILYTLTRIVTTKKLQDTIDKQQKQEDIRLYDARERFIVLPKLKNITEEELELLKNRLHRLEETKYIDIDIDYDDSLSVLIAYQQLYYYKKYNIELQDKLNNVELIGLEEILDKKGGEY